MTSSLVEHELGKAGADTFLDQVLRFDVTTMVVDDPVKRVDKMTINGVGLEARVPFLDHELVELAARMPPALRLKEGTLSRPWRAGPFRTRSSTAQRATFRSRL